MATKRNIFQEDGRINMLEYARYFLDKYNYKNIAGIMHTSSSEGLIEVSHEERGGNLIYELESHVDNIGTLLIRGIESWIKRLSIGGEVSELMSNLNPYGMLLQNGVYDFKKKKLKKYSDDDMGLIKNILPYTSDDIVNKDKPKTFLNFLYEVFEGEQDRGKCVDLIQEFMGLCLIPNTKYEKALFIFGLGGNGKGVLVDAIQNMVGSNNYSNVGISEIGDKQYRYKLFGKLVNIDSDLFVDTALDKEHVKKVISGETIVIKKVYKEPLSIKPFSRLIVCSNYMPKVKNNNLAASRRFMFLEFKNSFIGREDLELKAKIAGESKLIFSRAVKGLERLLKHNKFTLPNQIKENEKRFLKI